MNPQEKTQMQLDHEKMLTEIAKLIAEVNKLLKEFQDDKAL